MFLGCNWYKEDGMENKAGRLAKSRVPPKSKFNDEEATAVLRLIVEQEKILNNATVSPVLNITADKLKRLPPLGASLRESFDADDELESKIPRNHTAQHHDNSGHDAFLRKPALIRAKEYKETGECCGAATLRKPKVPQIYSTPKITRPRDKERPRESYGRNMTSRLGRRATSSLDTHVNRPSNPAPLDRDCDTTSRAINTISPHATSDLLQLNDELLDRPICPVPPRASSPPSYIN